LIGDQVSFYGLLSGMTYPELSKIIKPFYTPHEKKLKDDKKQVSLGKEATQLEMRAKAESYFHAQLKDLLSNEEWTIVTNRIMAIPFHKSPDVLSDAIRELRKTYYRSHEPWTREEEEVLEWVVKNCNDLPKIIKLFGRSENSIVAMAAKWL
jgi:hypothetical protein